MLDFKKPKEGTVKVLVVPSEFDCVTVIVSAFVVTA
jgi:hypothetical protein